jgi:hypothetical protein
MVYEANRDTSVFCLFGGWRSGEKSREQVKGRKGMKRIGMIIAIMALAAAAVFGQGVVTDFTGSDEAPLVTKGDFVLQGTVLVQYQGKERDVVIPGDLGITEIGDHALAQEDMLSVVIPEGVQRIGEGAFGDCYSLSKVSIPSSVTDIGDRAFIQNPLTDIIVDPANLAYRIHNMTLMSYDGEVLIVYFGKDENYVIPDGVVIIGDNAFNGKNLVGVTVPASVTSIGNSAFRDNKLTSVIIPASVTSIGDFAFYRNALTSVSIPASVTSIGDFAFYGNALTSVIIPARDRKSTRLNSSHPSRSRMPSSA